MKKLMLPLMAVAILVALYEQSKPKPNVYTMVGALLVFMYGMMRFSSKVKSKSGNSDGGISER